MFDHFLNKNKAAIASIFVLSLAGLLSCASTGSPGGGLYDETPPVLVRSDPGEGAVSVNKQKITFRFNENIKLDNANEKLTISPPQEKMPSVLSNAKTLTIELKDTLKSDVTYTIDLGDAVQDNNEGNPLENLTLTFSTGDHIDTMKVLGTLLNAQDLEPVTGAFVGIYTIDEDGNYPKKGALTGDSLQLAIDSIVSLYPDSIFSLRSMERAGKTDSKGRFTISGVGPGRYRIYALNDGNTNYKYDLFTEDIAFSDSLVIPSVGSHMAHDTIWNRFDSTKVDSIYVHEVTDYYPNDICLRMFNEGRVNRYLDDQQWRDSTTLTFRFAAHQPEPPVITLIGREELGPAAIDKNSWLICEPNPTNDTITYWLRDSVIYHSDTLALSVTYPFTKNGIETNRTDTIRLTKPEVKTVEKSKGDDEKKSKKSKKRKKEEEQPIDSLPPKPIFMTLKMLEKSLEIGARPHIETSAPLDTLDISRLRLEQSKDTTWVPLDFELKQDSLCLRRYTVIAKPHFSPGTKYRLIADSASMCDIYGHVVDSTAITFDEKKTEDYAHLLFAITGVEGPAFVQALNDKDKPVMQVPVIKGQAKFTNIAPGKYFFRLIEDTNDNGKFDVGSLAEHRQPENVCYFSTMLELRNWQYSQVWDIRAVKAEEQKPDEVKQNKPKEKQKKKSKNEEYLKEHPRSRKK